MTNQLTPRQKQQLAVAMFAYFGERHPTRAYLKIAYENENRGNVRTLNRKMDNEGAKLSEEEADWVINQLINKIEPLPLRTLFLRTVQQQPEEFGYTLPNESLSLSI